MKWNITKLNGYVPFTTFWQDFSIADRFGMDAVRDTFHRAFSEWKEDYKYLTELVLVLNHKAWQHCTYHHVLAEAYMGLYAIADQYACENLHGEKALYYFKTTD